MLPNFYKMFFGQKGKPARPIKRYTDRKLRQIEREFYPLALEIEDTPPSPLPRMLLWVISMLAVSGVAWSYFGQLDVISTARGRVMPDGRLKVLQAADNAIVRAIHMREGVHVRKGDLLVEFDPTVSNADLHSSMERATMAQLELIRLKAELTGEHANYNVPGARPDTILLQETLRAAREADFGAKLAEARNIWQSREMARAAAEDSLRKLIASTKSAAEKEARVRPYVGTVMSRFDYLKLKDELNQNENDLAAQRNEVDDLRQQCAAAEQRIRQVEHERRTQIVTDTSDSMNRLASLNAELGRASQFNAQMELRSPVDGVVQAVGITTPGGVVSAAQTLATIVPNGTPLVVEAQISNEDIGFVRVGQKVDIKVDTFPFQKYGTIPGTVVTISPDSEPDAATSSAGNGASAASTGSNAAYRVRIRPIKTALDINGDFQEISSGMTVQADIKTDRRRIVEFFLSPVLKYLDEGLKVR